MEEIAIGVVNSKYEAFLFYEKLDKFLALRGQPDRCANALRPDCTGSRGGAQEECNAVHSARDAETGREEV